MYVGVVKLQATFPKTLPPGLFMWSATGSCLVLDTTLLSIPFILYCLIDSLILPISSLNSSIAYGNRHNKTNFVTIFIWVKIIN